MGKSATNISVVLGFITVVFAGYYLYTQNGSTGLGVDIPEQNKENMLRDTQIFAQRSEILTTQIKMDTRMFKDPKFTSLRSFSTDFLKTGIGRTDPFADTDVIMPISQP